MDAVGEATHAERRAAARGVPALDRVQRGRPISPALLCDASAAGISPKEEGSTFESPRPSRRPASRSSTSASPWARGSCSIGPTPSGLPATAGNGRQRPATALAERPEDTRPPRVGRPVDDRGGVSGARHPGADGQVGDAQARRRGHGRVPGVGQEQGLSGRLTPAPGSAREGIACRRAETGPDQPAVGGDAPPPPPRP